MAELLPNAQPMHNFSVRDFIRYPPKVTRWFVLLFTAIFAGQLLTWNFDLGLLRWGANSAALVEQGQYFRLLTANLLHGGVLHYALNALAVLSVGSLIESLIGSARTILVYGTSAIGGATASCVISNATLSIGASTTVFGLVGALAVLGIQYRHELPVRIRQPLWWWALILGVNGALSIWVPRVDVAGHAGGLVAGLITTILLYAKQPSLHSSPPAGYLTKMLAILTITIGAIAVFQSVYYAVSLTEEKEFEAIVIALGDEGTELLSLRDATHINNEVWATAIAPKATKMKLHRARDQLLRAMDGIPDVPAFRDTIATLDYRLGDFDAAVAGQRLAISIGDTTQESIYHSQLARFLTARHRQSGPLLIGGAKLEDVDVSWSIKRIKFKTKTIPPKGLLAFLILMEDEELLGLLELNFGPTDRQIFDIPIWQLNNFQKGAKLTIALIDASGCACDKEIFTPRFWPLNPEVASYP